MVYYLSESGNGINRYAELDSGVLDVPRPSIQWGMQYAEPDKVHPRALKESASVRQQGYWVKPESMPKQYLWANGNQPLPDVMPGFVVSPRFRDLVEQFEPGVHQFVPVAIYKQKKAEPVATYYWFIVGQRLDSVDREHTTYAWVGSKSDPEDGHWTRHIINFETMDMNDIPGAKLVFSNSKVEGRHIWHDPHLLTFANGLCSDAFAHAVVSSQITGVVASPRESV